MLKQNIFFNAELKLFFNQFHFNFPQFHQRYDKFLKLLELIITFTAIALYELAE